MESWMINIVIALSGVVGTYAVLRFRVVRLEEDLKAHFMSDNRVREKEEITREVIHKDFLEKLNTGFKRLDTTADRVTVLERDTSTHLTMPIAEDKFVSKGELELHLKNIELKADHTNKVVDSMSGKLDELTILLSTNIVKTLSAGATN
jgi:hypothetical protein